MHICENGHKTVLRMTMGFNAHVHLREIDQLVYTVPHSARQFWGVVAMPNLRDPLVRGPKVLIYQKMIEEIGGLYNPTFRAIVPLYLSDDTSPEDIFYADKNGIRVAKLYPMGATTQSHRGVTDLHKIFPVLEMMQKVGMILSVHCEVTDDDVDFFDRERVFVTRYLSEIVYHFPALRIVFEHVSTKEGVQFVMSASASVVATITVQHLMFNRNDLFKNGLHPSLFCLPIVNSRMDQEAVCAAVFHEKFILGTDSAPHIIQTKYCDGGKGGCFTEPQAMALYAHVCEKLHALSVFEEFASLRGPRFYGLEPSTQKVQLTRYTSLDAQESSSEHMLIGESLYARPIAQDQKMQWHFDGVIV